MFFAKLTFFSTFFSEKLELGGLVLLIPGGVVPQYGGGKCAPRPRLPFLGVHFEKYFFQNFHFLWRENVLQRTMKILHYF